MADEIMPLSRSATSPRRRRADPAGADPQGDRVYTEADVAAMRERWEAVAREHAHESQLATIVGRLDALPQQIREIARSVFLEMRMQEAQAHSRNADRLFSRSSTLMAAGMLLVAVVTLYKTLA